MATGKSQFIEKKVVTQVDCRLSQAVERHHKMKVEPGMFMITNDLKN
jgi:hypothetical protein